jgi:CheY-like chemotaxis protein
LSQINNILVVDDDDNWCFLSKKILQKAGYKNHIVTAKNGLEALNKLKAIAVNGDALPELIFLDIKMPVMDGFEFLEHLNKPGAFDLSNNKVYICSSSLHPKDRERAKLYPISGFITKPLSAEDLKDILV